MQLGVVEAEWRVVGSQGKGLVNAIRPRTVRVHADVALAGVAVDSIKRRVEFDSDAVGHVVVSEPAGEGTMFGRAAILNQEGEPMLAICARYRACGHLELKRRRE